MNERPTRSRQDTALGPAAQDPHQFPVTRDYSTASAGLCNYCGAALDPFYYFCLRCSTPYKTLEAITGSARPAPLSDADRIKRLAPHAYTVFWTFAAVLVGCGLLSLISLANANLEPVFYFIASLAIFITAAIFACIHWRPLLAQFKVIGFNKWEAWAGIGALIPLLSINYGFHWIVKSIHPDSVSDPGDGMPLVVGILLICVFPAITEEIAFRGLVQYWLEVAIAPWKALLLASAMFAGLHFTIISFPYLFLVGLTLAIVRRRTGSLYPGMLMHFLHNLAVITLFNL